MDETAETRSDPAAETVVEPGAETAGANTARARQAKKRTRIQIENEERILDAGLDVFSTYGFRGATVDQIAERCGMSKPNLLYYFRRKQDIYYAVLQRTLETWLTPLQDMDPAGDPGAEVMGYVRQKLALSREKPMESRLFANEILHGAPVLGRMLKTGLREIVHEKAAAIRGWIEAGQLATVDPVHLIFMIWATTQHYADFEVQVDAVTGSGLRSDETFARAEATLMQVFMHGILPR